MLISAVSALVVAQSSLEIPEGLMNNPVYPYHVVYVKRLYLFPPRLAAQTELII